MTPQAIRDGFDKLRSDEQMLGLADAARSRCEADWLVGINGTRAMTAFNSRDGGFFLTTVGRVQTPTLSIVVEREEKIRKHVARDYWEVKASFDAAGRAVRRQVVRPQVEEEPGRCRGPRRPAVERGRRRGHRRRGARPAGHGHRRSQAQHAGSPLLYDLTTLQREANSRFGFSAKTTLSLAQALYEKHKVLTYPRTDSRALPEDYLPIVKQTFGDARRRATCPARCASWPACAQGPGRGLRQADQARVRQRQGLGPLRDHPDAAGADSSLSEIEPSSTTWWSSASSRCSTRAAEFMVTTRISKVGEGAEHRFQTNGKVLVKPGWLAVYGKEAQDEDANLVPVAPGEQVRTERRRRSMR